MGVIATAGSLGGSLACTLAAPSGTMMALAGFFGGGTVGGLLGALAVGLLAERPPA